MSSQQAAYLVSCAEMADQPYGAPRHTCVQKAGTNIAHLKAGWRSCVYIVSTSPPLPVGAGRGGVGAQAPHPLHQPLPRRRVFRASGHVAEAAGRGQGRAGGQARGEGEDAAEAGRRGHA